MPVTKPILYSADMILAQLDGRKRQTRRAQGLEEINKHPDWWRFVRIENGVATFENIYSGMELITKCPYAVDYLWVRETLEWEQYASRNITSLIYRADKSDVMAEIPDGYVPPRNAVKTHKETGDNIPYGSFYYYTGVVANIFMPRWASRLTNKVVSVRAERLQNISELDAIAEGVYKSGYEIAIGDNEKTVPTPRAAYRDLWDSINRKKHPWSNNPWVWRIEFEVIRQNVDAVIKESGYENL